MIATVIRFRLPPDTDWQAVRRTAVARAGDLYLDVPGLRSKAFIVDVETSTYGGVYAWETRAALDDFLASPVFAGAKDRFGEPTIDAFEVPAYVEAGALVHPVGGDAR